LSRALRSAILSVAAAERKRETLRATLTLLQTHVQRLAALLLLACQELYFCGLDSAFDESLRVTPPPSILGTKAPPPVRLIKISAAQQAPHTEYTPLMYHAEVLRRDGVEVGYVRAASYGHTLGGAVGLAMVTGPLDGDWTVEINGALYPAKVSLRPFYDAKNARIKL
jgi:hypothetical protein